MAVGQGNRDHAGEWINPDAGEIEFGTYAGQWMKDRILKTRTRELYGLLHSIMETASDDELIRGNPCRIDGAGQED